MGTVERAGIALALLGIALGFGAWLYVLVAPQPSVYVGLALAVGCVATLSGAFFVWSDLSLSVKIPIVCVFSLGFLLVFVWRGIPSIMSQPDVVAILLRIEKSIDNRPVEPSPSPPESPNNKTNPTSGPRPRRAQRKPSLKLMFKDSPLFTKARKDRITEQMEDFYLYLKGAGLEEVPKEIPPIGVGRNYGGAVIYPGPIYLGNVTIPETAIDDPIAPVIVYAQYSFGSLMDVHNFNRANQDRRQRAALIFEAYFVSSFSNNKPSAGTGEIAAWSDFLWDVRKQYGQQFSDTATVFTLKAFNDFGEEGGNQKLDLNTYVRNSFIAGESAADNNLTKLQGINELLRKDKLIP